MTLKLNAVTASQVRLPLLLVNHFFFFC
jgi:hypothetical protein